MEDPNMLAADCIVICCCCECLALQIVLLLLLELPCKLVRKTREFAKRIRRSHGEKEGKIVGMSAGYEDEVRGTMRNDEGDGLGLSSCCMEEIEKVMGDLHDKGEFGFGSFWGKGNSVSAAGSCRDHEHQFICPTNVISCS